MSALKQIRAIPMSIIIAELLALAATLYLFLVPAFKKYQGIIFPGSKPPGFETGWQHFGYWPPISGTPPNIVVFCSMVAPPLIVAFAAMSLMIKRNTFKLVSLWVSFIIMVITILYRPFDIGYFFVPAAIALFIVALVETKKSFNRRVNPSRENYLRDGDRS